MSRKGKPFILPMMDGVTYLVDETYLSNLKNGEPSFGDPVELYVFIQRYVRKQKLRTVHTFTAATEAEALDQLREFLDRPDVTIVEEKSRKPIPKEWQQEGASNLPTQEAMTEIQQQRAANLLSEFGLPLNEQCIKIIVYALNLWEKHDHAALRESHKQLQEALAAGTALFGIIPTEEQCDWLKRVRAVLERAKEIQTGDSNV